MLYIYILYYIHTVFSLISAPRPLINFETWKRGEEVLGGTYFKGRERNNIKCQNLAIFSFKMRMRHKFSLSVNQM